MQFVTVRDFRSSPKAIWDKLSGDEEIVVTNNGKPAYIMLGVDEADFEETLIDLRKVRAQRAVTRMQRRSADLGNDTMTLDEINAEIAADRSVRM